eukprot:GDKI01014393.1.p2 GENE.GDKI01014393.1~~GDKI01014393.1.p2  ORF type:complete len:107 (+),score=39.64 GDKI01014393.1:79-399(+)
MVVHHADSMAEFQAQLQNAGGKLVVVDFFATWCGPCVRIAPVVEQLSNENADVVFVKVDVDKAADVSQTYHIEAMPTFIYFKNGQEISRHTGASADKIKASIAQHK